MPQIVPFIASATSAVAAGTATFAQFATVMAVNMAMSVSLTALQMALAPNPEMNAGGISGDMRKGADVARSFILGTWSTAGHEIMPAMTYDIDKDDNKYISFMINVSDLPVTEFSEAFVDGKKVTLLPIKNPGDAGYHFDDQHGHRIAEGDQRGWFRFTDGTQTTVDPVLATFGNYPHRPIDASFKMTGVAYAVATFKHLNKDPKYTSYPSVSFTIKGKKLYDPRKDSTNGGTGAQRWADPNTYEFTDNPVVMAYNVMRGIKLSDGEGTYGFGARAEALPNSYWFRAMNICDEPGTQPASTSPFGDTKRYRAGIEVFVDKSPIATVEAILNACGGLISEVGGQYIIKVGPPSVAAATITDDMLLADNTAEFTMFAGLQETYNAITANYPDPSNAWQTASAEPLFNPAWEARDGQRLTANISFPTTFVARQVRRQMREMAADNRRERKHSIVLGAPYIGLNPTDTIRWTSETNGYNSKLFEIIDTTIDPRTLQIALNIREVDPEDYDFDEVSDGRVPEYPSTDVVYPITLGVAGFNAVPFIIKDNNGKARRPAIKLTWPDDLSYPQILYQLKLAGDQDTDLVEEGTISDTGTGSALISASVTPNTAYQIRAKAVRKVSNNVSWGNWISVTSPAIFIGDDDFANGVVGLFEDAGMKATREIANRTIPGAYDGELAWSRADNALFMWDASKAKWIPFIERSLNEVLEETMVAQKLATIKVVTALPSSGRTGDQVFLTTDKKLYRWDGTKWTAEVAAPDITGLLTKDQIAEIEAAKISGQLVGTQIANSAITAQNLANNAVNVQHIVNNAINSSKIANNAIISEKLATNIIKLEHITDNAIAPNKLALIQGHNLAADPNIQFINTWTASAAYSFSVGKWTHNGTSAGFQRLDAARVSIIGGLRYRSKITIGGGTYTTATLRFRQIWLDAAGAQVGDTGANGITITPAPFSYAVENNAPANAAFVIFRIEISSQTGTVEVIASEIASIATSETIQDASIITNKLAAGAVVADKVQANTLTGDLFIANTIGAREIVANSITAIHISANTITGNNLLANAITGREISANSITANHIVANTITGNLIAANTIVGNHIIANTITGDALAVNAIGAREIAANTIVGNHIVSNTITGIHVIANTITGNKLVVDAITAREIKANEITATHMTADSITGREVKANSITAGHIVTDSITSAHIKAGAIGTDQLAARAIVASKLAIADFTNLVPDDQLQDDYSWLKGVAFTNRVTTARSDIKSVGDLFYTSSNNTANNDQSATTRSFFPVTPADELFVSAQMIRANGTKMQVWTQIQFFDKNDAILATGGTVNVLSYSGTNNTAAPYEGSVVVPAGALQARLRFLVRGSGTDGNVAFGAPTVRVKGTGKLIVDGSIEANSIKAGTITGGLLASTGIITQTGQIADLTVDTLNLKNGSVTVTSTYTSPIGATDNTTTWFEVGRFVVNSPNAGTYWVRLRAWSPDGGSGGASNVFYRWLRDGVLMTSGTISNKSFTTNGWVDVFDNGMDTTTAGNHTYVLQMRTSGFTGYCRGSVWHVEWKK